MRLRVFVMMLAVLVLAGSPRPADAQPPAQTPPAPGHPPQASSPCEAQNLVIASYALEMANLKIRVAEYERIIKTLSPAAPATTPAK